MILNILFLKHFEKI